MYGGVGGGSCEAPPYPDRKGSVVSKTICGVRCFSEVPLAFELNVNDDGMGLTLSWADTIFSKTIVKDQDGKAITGTEHFLNEIFREIRGAIMAKALIVNKVKHAPCLDDDLSQIGAKM
jgi:hypothetical protein